jgi:hypothetical protein
MKTRTSKRTTITTDLKIAEYQMIQRYRALSARDRYQLQRCVLGLSLLKQAEAQAAAIL